MSIDHSQPKVWIVLGATGFFGSAIVRRLAIDPSVRRVVCVSRSSAKPPGNRCEMLSIGEFSEEQRWCEIFDRADVVVHAAGLAHQSDNACIRDFLPDRVLAEKLLHHAAQSRVNRFIYVSSAGVLGEQGVFYENSPPAPVSNYARNKLFIEQRLSAVGERHNMDVRIVRPTLMYGAGAVGNMRKLANFARLPIPLPLGEFRRPKTLTSVTVAADALVAFGRSDQLRSATALLASERPTSVAQFLSDLRRSIERRPLMVPIKENFLKWTCPTKSMRRTLGKLSQECVYESSTLASIGWSMDQQAMAFRDLRAMMK